MSLSAAKRYIDALRRKQDNPYLWPDFLTGLPDKPAIMKKVIEVYPQLGKYSIIYLRVANIQPFLIKYGPDRHVDIIQWTAAILKTTVDEYKGFVGAFSSHDFVAICSAKDSKEFVDTVSRLFEKKIMTFYSDEDLKRGSLFSFIRDGKKIDVGFMKLVSTDISTKPDIPKDLLIPHLGRLCAELERAL